MNAPARILGYGALCVAACYAGELRGQGKTSYEKCAECHDRQIDRPIDGKVRDLVRRDESSFWKVHDRHLLAYKVLESKLGQEMLNKLVIAQGNTDAAKVAVMNSCLACHANRIPQKRPPLYYQRGVTCEACHSNGKSDAWVAEHAAAEKLREWRAMTPDKKAEKGMINVRDPVFRAEQCFSCHLGNAEEGKVVTHAMYAAGHPMLPTIELVTFASAMPPHWRHMPEKGDFRFRGEFVAANFPKQERDPSFELPRTKAVVIGGTVALREWTQLFASQFKEPRRPDFALFDCAACHHDLQVNSWRRTAAGSRYYVEGRLGRPMPSLWPSALAKLGIHQLSLNDQGDVDLAVYQAESNKLEGHLRRLFDAATVSPFGNGSRVLSTADDLIEYLDGVISQLRHQTYDRESARAMLQEIARISSERVWDFDSARQLVAAARVIKTETAVDYPRFNRAPKVDDPPLPQQIIKLQQQAAEDRRRLDQWRVSSKPHWDEVAGDFKQLAQKLALERYSFTKRQIQTVDFVPQPILDGEAQRAADVFRKHLQQQAQFDPSCLEELRTILRE